MPVRHDGLSLRDPLVSVDAAGEGVESTVDDLLFLGVECGDLFPRLDAFVVQHTFELRADALDLLEIVDVIWLDAGSAKHRLALHPLARRPCGTALGVLVGLCKILFVLTVERSFELCDTGVGCVEVVAHGECRTQLTFELCDPRVAIVEVVTVGVELCLKVSNATLRAVEFVAGCAQRGLKLTRAGL